MPAGPAPVPGPRRLCQPARPVGVREERAITPRRLRARSLVPASSASPAGCPAPRRRRVLWGSGRLCGARCTRGSGPPFGPHGGLRDTDQRGIQQGVCRVSSASETGAPPVPDPACRPAAVAAVPRLPSANPLGQSAPRPPCPGAGQPGLDQQAVVFGRSPNRSGSTRQPMRDLIPWSSPSSIASHQVEAPPAASTQCSTIGDCCEAGIWSGCSLTTRPSL